MGQYGVRLSGDGDLLAAIRLVRGISSGSITVGDIRSRIARGEIVVTWDDDEVIDVANPFSGTRRQELTERFAAIRADVASLVGTGYRLSYTCRPSSVDRWDTPSDEPDGFEGVFEQALHQELVFEREDAAKELADHSRGRG